VRILILNWRCPRNPKAGGAERLTYGIARRLVEQGDEVEWFSATFPGAPSREEIDGIRFVRAGRQWTVHFHAFRVYRKFLRARFDVIIDEVNTIPFFTPWWSSIPCFMLIPQLAREVWWYESKFPLSAIGYALEPLYLRLYRNVPAFTISESTHKDLVRLGFSGPITVVPVGLEHTEPKISLKARRPTFIYVGRMAPSKRVGGIIRAFHLFHQAVDGAQLWLVGDGPAKYERELRRLVGRLGLVLDVHFLGRLTNQEKAERVAQAHMLLMASVREGWGLVVSEAGALGTPTVGYDVPGLRDSVANDKTGLLTRPFPADLSSAMIRLWRDPALYGRLAREGIVAAAKLSLDEATADIRGQLLGGRARINDPILRDGSSVDRD
jgi:glycosyltransferase involved in cell wall biosynthesis